MASNKDKTSKTAHVMNLLSRNRGADAPEAAQESAPAAQSALVPPVAAPAAPILSPIDEDAAASSQIKEALEAELAEEAAPAAPQPAPVQKQSAPVREPSVSAASESAPVPEAPTSGETEKIDPTISYVNVIQVLVEEKAERYMEMFGLCCCPKCQADVKAYALNHLPPKYVVMEQHEMIPKLTFYEAQNSSDITAQIIKACKIVMSTPHHGRK